MTDFDCCATPPGDPAGTDPARAAWALAADTRALAVLASKHAAAARTRNATAIAGTLASASRTLGIVASVLEAAADTEHARQGARRRSS